MSAKSRDRCEEEHFYFELCPIHSNKKEDIMKKVMVLLIAVLFISPLLICVPKARAATDWKQYYQNEVATNYYDAKSIQRSGGVVQVKILSKNTPRGTNMFPSLKVDHYIRLAEINCSNKTFLQKRIILYRADGSLIGDHSSDDPDLLPEEREPYAIHTSSTEHLLYRIVCGF
jgi:hypothetical protein